MAIAHNSAIRALIYAFHIGRGLAVAAVAKDTSQRSPRPSIRLALLPRCLRHRCRCRRPRFTARIMRENLTAMGTCLGLRVPSCARFEQIADRRPQGRRSSGAGRPESDLRTTSTIDPDEDDPRQRQKLGARSSLAAPLRSQSSCRPMAIDKMTMHFIPARRSTTSRFSRPGAAPTARHPQEANQADRGASSFNGEGPLEQPLLRTRHRRPRRPPTSTRAAHLGAA